MVGHAIYFVLDSSKNLHYIDLINQDILSITPQTPHPTKLSNLMIIYSLGDSHKWSNILTYYKRHLYQ